MMCMLQTGLSCAYFAQERKSALTAVLDGATAMAETYASEGNIVTLPGGDNDPADVTDPVGGDEDPSGGNTDYTMEKYRRYLSGQWIAVEGEVEGDRYKMEEVGMTVTLEFQEADGVTEDGRGTWSMGAWYEYTNKYGDHEKLDGLSVKFLEGPMYYGCGNDEWYAELVGGPENVEYTVTVIDNNYLEMHRHVEDSYVVWVVYCERADGQWIED